MLWLTGRAIPRQVASTWKTKRLAASPTKASLKESVFLALVPCFSLHLALVGWVVPWLPSIVPRLRFCLRFVPGPVLPGLEWWPERSRYLGGCWPWGDPFWV